jgi:hypothetical protein
MEIDMQFQFNDGGRAQAGFSGRAGDCVARSIAIVTGLPYAEVHARLAEGNCTQRARRGTRGKKKGRTADQGINTNRKWFKDFMAELGFVWTPTMSIGQGCTVHLKADELPSGRLILSVSRHYVAMIDGVVHDTHDPSRHGTRCVYGYWAKI